MRPTTSHLLRAAGALGALWLMLTGSAALAAPLVAPFDGGDVTAIKAAASGGDVRAMVRLGRIYETADGVDQDFAEARRLYGLAAAKGGAEAMRRLGRHGRRRSWRAPQPGRRAALVGDGRRQGRRHIDVSPRHHRGRSGRALDWYVKSAEAGCQEAMRELGDRY